MKYNEVIKYLFDNQDLKYRNFHQKLLNNDEINLIGVRLPIIRKIIKKIDYIDFIQNTNHFYYEEVLIHGLVIGNVKDFNRVEELLSEFLKYNNSWATNDSTATNLKIFIKNQEKGFNLIKKYLNSNNIYTIRFGIVLLLSYYINDEYIDRVVECIINIKNNDYYVEMANAWLISVCYIKYKNKIIKIYKDTKLDKFTNNKSISKINDSYRTSKENKDILKKYKRDI